jgi:hypothetical protein
MMTPDFELMTVTELRTYAIAHRADSSHHGLRVAANFSNARNPTIAPRTNRSPFLGSLISSRELRAY